MPRTSTAATPRATHTNAVSREIGQAESRINDAIRFARSGCQSTLEPCLKDLVDDALHRSAPKRFLIRALLKVLFGFRKAGTSKAHLLAVADAFRNEIELMYAEEEAATDYGNARVEEEVSEGDADVAEVRFDNEKSYPAYQALVHAHRVHEIKVKAQIKAAARLVGAFA